MGVGKTTIGKMAAKKVGWTFVDLDRWIVDRENKSINEIFEDEGEASFRSLEKKYLSQLVSSTQDHTIIALGGGTPCFNEMMDWLNLNGTTIYLSSSVEHLTKILSLNKDKRPLIKNAKNVTETVQQLLEKRKPFYEKAQFTILIDSISMNKAGEILVELLHNSISSK